MFRSLFKNTLFFNSTLNIRSYCSSSSFNKILVANRGEIACRIIQTCRKLQIPTVSIYSKADSNALHVKSADESIYIGSSLTSESYLNIPKIIEAAKISGAQAIHPGYGYLSENLEFISQVEKNGLTFIGPNINTIEFIKDKLNIKNIARGAKINVIPGHIGEIISEEHLLELAKEIQYPIIIKPVSGKIPMRKAKNEKEALTAYKLAKNDANILTDKRLYVEKYISNPRIIEIQVIADKFGNKVHLHERECSIQQNNHTIIEESPSPIVQTRLRNEITEQAIKLLNVINYDSIGTVKFIISDNETTLDFYLLGITSRLQASHTISEEITHLDLVQEMINIAAGNKLDYSQDDILFDNKWAIQCRICAEDTSNFLPSTGTITEYVEPSILDNTIRIDSGITSGTEISPYYTPLLAKITSVKEDRIQALDNMKTALDTFRLHGIKHNIGLLRSILCNPRFMSGDIHNHFILEEYPHGYSGKIEDRQIYQLITLGTLIHYEDKARNLAKSNNLAIIQPDEYLLLTFNNITYKAFYDSQKSRVKITNDNIDDEILDTSYKWGSGFDSLETIINNEYTTIKVVNQLYDGLEVLFLGNIYKLQIQTPLQYKLSQYLPKDTNNNTVSNHIKSPTSGKIHKINIKQGDIVDKYQELIIINIMNTQHTIKAKSKYIIDNINVKEGDCISNNTILINTKKLEKEE